jgi:uncharacterized damage-inducible protein DinB
MAHNGIHRPSMQARAAAAGIAVAALVLLSAAPTWAQQAGLDASSSEQAEGANLFADLDEDVAVVRNKLLGLAEAIPEEAYDWRPGEGVRSVRETLLHVAADNYFIPISMGVHAPESSGISDYMSTKAFEERPLTKKAVMDELDTSFMHLRRILSEGDPATLGSEMSLFGMESTVQKAWILTTTHLHEHLGQMIAYARSNDVVPPWSM